MIYINKKLLFILVIWFFAPIDGKWHGKKTSHPVAGTLRIPGDLNGLPTNWIDNYVDTSLISLIFYYKTTPMRFSLDDAAKILTAQNFDLTKTTLFYFYGYSEHVDEFNTQSVINAYATRDDFNVIIIDYRYLVQADYIQTIVPNLHKITPPIAQAVFNMNSSGLNIENTHFVGHSLGVHMAGSTGNDFKLLTEGARVIPRITGLDPAFPLFYPPIGRRITPKDGAFVDIIHADAWVYGAPVKTGVADFWPNSGHGDQPGCPPRTYNTNDPNDFCSHHRSVRFWTESVQFPKSFLAIRCNSWGRFKSNTCPTRALAYMGLDARPGNYGNYYLQTNSETPFGRKNLGIIYESH